MKISVLLINHETLSTKKAQVIASKSTLEEFDTLAINAGYNIKKKDQTLAGYYYAHPDGNAMVTFPSYHKLGTWVDYR